MIRCVVSCLCSDREDRGKGTTMEMLIENGKVRVEGNLESLVARGYVGRSKKAKFYYKFESVQQMKEWTAKWVDLQMKRLEAREAMKAKWREENKQAREKAKEEIKAKLAPGVFLKGQWGCTMSRVDWYEVLEVKGNKVELGRASYEDNSGGYDGYSTLLGKGNGEKIAEAKVFNGRIILGKGSWKYLEFANVGDKVHVYCD